jgi:hypothetical protein
MSVHESKGEEADVNDVRTSEVGCVCLEGIVVEEKQRVEI